MNASFCRTTKVYFFIFLLTLCTIPTLTGGAVYQPGDVNHSGTIDIADAITALQAMAGHPVPNLYTDADLNRDGKIDMAEAIGTLQGTYSDQNGAAYYEWSLTPVD